MYPLQIARTSAPMDDGGRTSFNYRKTSRIHKIVSYVKFVR